MRPGHLAGIILIYVGAALAWVILGASVHQRSGDAETKLRTQVEGMWGAPPPAPPPPEPPKSGGLGPVG